MTTYTALIVDDEPIAREIIETLLSKFPEFSIAGRCGNALEAFSFISRQQVDLMFLDINMPEISGMDLLRNLKNAPKVIFTTAYSEYAAESYDLNAVDYLMKPISFERFHKAVTRALNELRTSGQAQAGADTPAPLPPRSADDSIMFVRSEGKLIRIDLARLWFIEGLKDYVSLWIGEERIIVHTTMKNMEELLSDLPQFIRVNKSYIINLKMITEVDGNMIRINGQSIPIGNTYREEVSKLLEKYKLL